MPDFPSITIERLMEESGHLYGYAVLRVGDHHHAEDLVQDSILAAWRQRDSYDGRSALRTWMCGILKHKILDHHRKAARTPSRPNLANSTDEDGGADPFDQAFDAHGSWKIDPSVGMAFLDETPDRALQRSELMDWISRCIAQLPERLRELFTARELDDMAVPEAAEVVGMNVGTAAVMLTRARQQVRACLQRSFL